jgi:AbrB family looped-hinge helix DNA binding protein
MTYSTTITSKGQMTLSAEMRRKLSIKPGERVRVSLQNDKVVIEKDNYLQELEQLRAHLTKRVQEKGLAGMSWAEVKKRADGAKQKHWKARLDRDV